MNIYKRNGCIFLSGFTEEYDWLTYDYSTISEPYFILNTYTRECFKRDILPYIKSKECYIPTTLFSEIKNFVANPISYEYTEIKDLPGVKYKPHQVQAINYMLKYKKFGFFLGPGSGKTIIAIGFLLSCNIKSALIVTPQKVIAQYKAELDKYIPGNNYVVTNYEQLHKHLSEHYDAFILDESHKVKNYSSNANDYCRIIAGRTEYTYLFTGTPQDKSRHEILAQLAILDPRVMPLKTRTIHRYFNLDDYFQPSTEKKAFSKELTSVISNYTWGKETEEVVTLTPENDYVLKCTKPKEYDTLVKDRVLIDKDEYRCVADNKGVLKIKLRELCNGHIQLENFERDSKLLKVDCDKANLLKNVLETKTNKCIIYYEFDNDLLYITDVLNKLNISYKIVNGKTNKKKSGEYISEFKENKYNILVMQSKSGNAGLDLTNVNDIIFYSLPESYIVFTQCKARVNRIGQTKECNYYYLVCKDTVEEQILSALKKKRNFSTRLFKIYN